MCSQLVKWKTKLVIFVLIILEENCAYPVINDAGISVPPPEIIKFMRRFGYLEQTPSDSEALYHESAIKHAIKNIQKFGALNQTGILDNNTLRLLTSPRCGVPDIEPHRTRNRRYVIGSKRWQKRRINYFIANWSPKVGEEKVMDDMHKAFSVWATYSNLKFRRVYDPSADIIVAFGARYHGDNYPFDGPGNILAHAFYPYEMQSYGGDVHFDDDENWKENSTNLVDGVDFFSVAVHELGHSLGLAHSPVYSSIMFPYYKGPGSNSLDFDDILAMYELYIKATFEDDNEGNDFTEEPTGSSDEEDITTQMPKAPPSPTLPTVTETSNEMPTYPTTYEGDFETVDDHQRKNGMITTAMPSPRVPEKLPTILPQATISPTEAVPNICTGHFDAVGVFRGDVFIFKGEYVWRLTEKYRTMEGYPIKIREMFPFLPASVERIDAAYERTTDCAIILFFGSSYWVYDGYDLIENSPKSITDYGLDQNITRINAAMIWPKNQRTYLFSQDQFWRYDEVNRQPDPDYPKSMRRWVGIPDNINAAATMPKGKTYFFKDNLYWLYNNRRIRPERGYPRTASNAWLGCPLMQRWHS